MKFLIGFTGASLGVGGDGTFPPAVFGPARFKVNAF